ncbi:MAG: general secretion pathway protein GspE [Geobacter sp.]|nr:general secretion pathway protein GspE [Geobacter sp.]
MTIKLGEMLIKAGKLASDQLEEALKYQVIFGGRLGTNLIEMGYIDEDNLAKVLSEKLGVPYVPADQLNNISPEVIKVIPKGIAQKYKVVPLALDRNRLTLVMTDPSDLQAIDEISFISGFVIKPMVAPEVRLVLALEKYYGIKRDLRYIPVSKTMSKPQAPTPQPPKPAPAQPVVPPRPAPTLAHDAEAIDFSAFTDLTEEKQSVETAKLSAVAATAPAPQAVFEEFEELTEAEIEEEEALIEAVERYTIDSISQELADARDRDEIADSLVRYAGQEFSQVALFLVKGNTAVGWRAMQDGKFLPGFPALSIPLNEPSVLKVVADTKSFYRGPLPPTPLNATIIKSMGGEAPDSANLIPLMMMGRVVNILYVVGSGADLDARIQDIQKLVGKASMAFEILILRNKIMMT